MATTDQKGSVLGLRGTPDRANDYLYVWNGTTPYRSTINNELGITGTPVGTVDSQTLTNKVITAPAISSPTLSGTLTGTYVIGGTPTFPASVVTLTGSQTLTNKILTSPTISSPTITNASMTADSISGFTTANTGTVYGLSIVAGVPSLANGSITPAKLSDLDWFKYIPANSYSSSIAGTWAPAPANTGTTFGGYDSLASGGTQNEEVQYKVVLAAGTYKCVLHYDKDVNRGIYTISVNGSSIGTVDGYSATRVGNAVTIVTTSLSIATSALCTVNVKMATKNASSANYFGAYYFIELVRTA